ncbi:Zn-ribbon domain-containing OB-fold protein [Spongiibacter marinus]|uniref:Zn-ribbon domain-containing OB-fold protein n=1 Tax=Spongiibacter marinus TaxID=354246 RepID=UPI0035BE817E
MKEAFQWDLDCDYSQPQGELYGQFLAGLKDKKILGSRIGEKSYFPVKQFCSETYQEPEAVLESNGVGVVESFTIYTKRPDRVDFTNAEIVLDPPYVVAAIRLNGSSQSMLHFLSEVDVKNPAALLEKVKAGLEVTPVWAEQRHGNILDILYFEPVNS